MGSMVGYLFHLPGGVVCVIPGLMLLPLPTSIGYEESLGRCMRKRGENEGSGVGFIKLSLILYIDPHSVYTQFDGGVRRKNSVFR